MNRITFYVVKINGVKTINERTVSWTYFYGGPGRQVEGPHQAKFMTKSCAEQVQKLFPNAEVVEDSGFVDDVFDSLESLGEYSPGQKFKKSVELARLALDKAELAKLFRSLNK